jgi:hypothetical protein
VTCKESVTGNGLEVKIGDFRLLPAVEEDSGEARRYRADFVDRSFD